MEMEGIQYLWQDRKRYFGLPLSFTRYFLSEDRLFVEEGLFNIKADEVLLYRVRDIDLNMKLTQRIFGVGTVCVHSSDQSMPHMDLKNVKNPRMVKELIHRSVEQAKDKRRMGPWRLWEEKTQKTAWMILIWILFWMMKCSDIKSLNDKEEHFTFVRHSDDGFSGDS